MNKYCIIAIPILLLHACTGSNKPISPADPVENKPDSFFPVTSFIKGQLISLDSLPVTPLQLTTINGKTDSAWIPKNELKPLLQPFITPDINETNFTKHFKETRFNDQTLNAITFTYDPVNRIPDSITLRHWDVYVDPQTGYVKKVYIVKEVKENSQVFTLQLTWQTNKQAKISTILQEPGGNLKLLKEVIYMWRFDPVN